MEHPSIENKTQFKRKMLKDSFNRVHDYLRISLTDACNLKCLYCNPELHSGATAFAQLMQADEIETIAEEFITLGVKKIRLTGGEPLVRKDAKDIMLRLSKLPVELTLTTNGIRLDEFTDVLREADISSVNVSLDTLDRHKFQEIAGSGSFDRIFNNVLRLIDESFHVKLNVVVIRGVNDAEINDFVELTKTYPLHVRFIEFMPFEGNMWRSDKVVSYAEILNTISSKFSSEKLAEGINDTAKKFKPAGHEGTFAVISTMSEPFCGNCNRLRLTADGKIKNCLFSHSETDILGALRNAEDIAPLIAKCVIQKAEALGGQFGGNYQLIDPESIINRKMIGIGG